MKEIRNMLESSLICVEVFLMVMGLSYIVWPDEYVKASIIFVWAISYFISSLVIIALCWLIDKTKKNRNVNLHIGNNKIIANTRIEQDENGLHITVPKGTKVEVKEV